MFTTLHALVITVMVVTGSDLASLKVTERVHRTYVIEGVFEICYAARGPIMQSLIEDLKVRHGKEVAYFPTAECRIIVII